MTGSSGVVAVAFSVAGPQGAARCGARQRSLERRRRERHAQFFFSRRRQSSERSQCPAVPCSRCATRVAVHRRHLEPRSTSSSFAPDNRAPLYRVVGGRRRTNPGHHRSTHRRSQHAPLAALPSRRSPFSLSVASSRSENSGIYVGIARFDRRDTRLFERRVQRRLRRARSICSSCAIARCCRTRSTSSTLAYRRRRPFRFSTTSSTPGLPATRLLAVRNTASWPIRPSPLVPRSTLAWFYRVRPSARAIAAAFTTSRSPLISTRRHSRGRHPVVWRASQGHLARLSHASGQHSSDVRSVGRSSCLSGRPTETPSSSPPIVTVRRICIQFPSSGAGSVVVARQVEHRQAPELTGRSTAGVIVYESNDLQDQLRSLHSAQPSGGTSIRAGRWPRPRDGAWAHNTACPRSAVHGPPSTVRRPRSAVHGPPSRGSRVQETPNQPDVRFVLM